MLKDRQAFKFGFLQKCAEAGMTQDETEQVLDRALTRVKSAVFGLEELAKLITTPALAGGKLLKDVGLPAAIAGPPLLGAGIGYTAARMGDIDDTDVEAVKQQELIDEYLRNANKIRQQKQRFQLAGQT